MFEWEQYGAINKPLAIENITYFPITPSMWWSSGFTLCTGQCGLYVCADSAPSTEKASNNSNFVHHIKPVWLIKIHTRPHSHSHYTIYNVYTWPQYPKLKQVQRKDQDRTTIFYTSCKHSVFIVYCHVFISKNETKLFYFVPEVEQESSCIGYRLQLLDSTTHTYARTTATHWLIKWLVRVLSLGHVIRLR